MNNPKSRTNSPKISQFFPLFLTFCLLFASRTAFAAQLIWDPANNGGVTITNATWDTTSSNWYNGTSDTVWAQTSATAALDGAVFGGSGSFDVTNATEVAFTNLTFLTSGYSFTNGDGLSGPGLYGVAASSIFVSAGDTVTFNSEISGPGNGAAYWILGNGAVVNLLAGDAGNQQPQFESTNAAGTFYLNGNYPFSVMYMDCTVYQTNGTVGPIAGGMNLGRPPSAILTGAAGAGVNTGVWYVIGTNTLLTTGTGSLNLARGGGNGTLIITNGGTFQTITSPTSGQNDNCTICVDNSAGEKGLIELYSGTINVGSANSTTGGIIVMMGSGASATTSATFVQSGGEVNAWGGVFFGENTAANYPAGCYAAFTNAGGILYIGNTGPHGGGIQQGTGGYPTNYAISFSGGTIGAFGNWVSPLPITLDGYNGVTTFQCADSNGNPHNISLSGALTGAGGLVVTGGGVLTLSGSNTYTGSSTVSNGTLVVNTAAVPTNGAVVVDDSLGFVAELSIVSTPGTDWSVTGLTYQNQSPTADFNFGSLTPSTSVAPVQVSGNVNFSATPLVTVEGSSLTLGTYPLIQYTGTLSGTAPTVAGTPSYCSGYITNIGKEIALVINSSTVNPALFWAVGNGVWDTSTPNWKGESTKYSDGDPVIFDDSASGASPITVTLNTVVNPHSVTANNVTKKYTITGTGNIAGTAGLVLQSGGTLTLATTNTYTGGTTLNAGQLNINNGGDASLTDSAIGNGPLTINAGVSIDNTGGSNVTLQPTIAENWNGSFTYVGASNSFNTGPGLILLNANSTLTVGGNSFTIGGSLNDNGNNFSLTKSGPGTLNLPTGNFFTGGFLLQSGLVNVGDPDSVGQGNFTINGGAIDNISGTELTLAPTGGFTWYGPFTYLGTSTNILDFSGTILAASVPITVTVASNTFECDGDITSGNELITKAGPGTWILGGASDNNNDLEMAVTAGEVIFAKISGVALANRPGNGLTVESNALVFDNGAGIPQVGNGDNVPITLESGGIFDINGNTETFDSLTMSNGVFRNSDSNTPSTLNITYAGGVISLVGTSNDFDFAPGASLNVNAVVSNTGSLEVTGMGELVLESSNSYTGETIIQSGTLAVTGSGSISNTSDIYLATSGSALDFSQNSNPTLTLNPGQTLSGIGVVTGLVASVPGGIIAPGSPTQVGTLTVTGNTGANTLGGTLLLSLDRTNSQTSSSVNFAGGTVTYGGILAVTNIGPALQVGDTFHLFPSGVTTFSGFNLATTDANGDVYTWNNNVAANGSITVSGVTAAINPNPGPLLFGRSGNTLSLSWPTNSGWILQTNSSGLANTNGWFPYPGSAGLTNVVITIGQSPATTFFRLAHP